MTDNAPDLEVSIDTDEAYELLTLTFDQVDGGTIKVGFNITEAQILHNMLGESITAMLLHKLNIPTSPETRH